jgi:hypothetical protein
MTTFSRFCWGKKEKSLASGWRSPYHLLVRPPLRPSELSVDKHYLLFSGYQNEGEKEKNLLSKFVLSIWLFYDIIHPMFVYIEFVISN